MAAAAAAKQSHAVKCLNKSPGGRRFVFKSFSQRVEEINIDVFRNLYPVSSVPSKGSSFFRDELLRWRELNTAEDFISFYEEVMPIVQTLPQILFHKERIFSELLGRVQMKAILSLEPILGLIAALSRDILDKFIPFLRRLVDTLVHLLKTGGDHDPQVLEQVFTSWSYLMMYLRKYLINDVVQLLKVTTPLRYYAKDYVQEFMAESISFLMRNSPASQLQKGIRRIIVEACKNSSSVRITGASALLWHIMRGTYSKLHSKAEHVVMFLLSNSILGIQNNLCSGSEAVVTVISTTFQRLCKELGHKELHLVWNCLLEEMRTICPSDGCLIHMNHLLSVLISTVQCSNGTRNNDYKPILELVSLLIEKYIIPSRNNEPEKHFMGVVNKTLELMLCLLDMSCIFDNLSILSSISHQWAPVFQLGGLSLLTFIKELVVKDPQIAHVFRGYIMRALDSLIESSPEEVLYLMLTFRERQNRQQSADVLGVISEAELSRICSFLDEKLCFWSKLINDIATEKGDSDRELHDSELAVLWGIFRCYSLIHSVKENHSLVMNTVDALKLLVAIEADNIAGLAKSTWQSVLAEALSIHPKILLGSDSVFSEVSNFLNIAKGNKTSAQILFVVAEFLDSVLGSANEVGWSKLPEFDVDQAIDAVSIFSDNLALANKAIRVSTLRILSHFAPLDNQLSMGDGHPNKKLKTEGSASNEDSQICNVIQVLLSIESTPLSVSTSRKVIISISRIQMGLTAGKISDAYIPLIANAVIGIFHNRFNHLWEPAMECLTTLICKYKGIVWDRFVQYLENYQSVFLSANDTEILASNSPRSNALGDCFNSYLGSDSDSTPHTTVLGLLLQSLQKVPEIAESRSRQLIPMFVKFLGYSDDNPMSMESFILHPCNGKEWKAVLIEWLELLRLMRNSRSLYRSHFLKDVLIYRLLDETDSNIQLKVLDCLLNWRDDYLVPYHQHLKNLIDLKNLREELTTWTISKESCCIQEDHRVHLVPLVVRILVPKVRKMKTLASHKHAGANRKTILCFLAQLDVDELPLFFSLLLKPLSLSNLGFKDPDIQSEEQHDQFSSNVLVKCITSSKIDNLSLKKRSGFLHVVEDILRSFDESRLKPFLGILLMIVVRILESCSSSLSIVRGSERCINTMPSEPIIVAPSPLTSTSIKQLKDLRSLCLKIISFVLNKYEDYEHDIDFWEIFFLSIKPLVETFKQEGSSSEKPSSLLSCFVAMSRSPNLVSLLDREANLIPTIFSILTVKTASDAVISSVLNFIENLLNLDNDLDHQENNTINRILVAHTDALIFSLNGLFQGRKETQRKSSIGPGKTELRILKLLARYVNQPSAATQLVDTMLPLFRKKAPSSDECIEGLHVIKGMIPFMDSTATGKVLNVIHLLLVSAELSIRLCICDILDGLASKDPSLSFLAKLLHELNATSALELGELDYDTRIIAYNKIKLELFYQFRENQAIVILSHCVYDMSSKDLILRQSASSSLQSFIQFAATVWSCEAKNCIETSSMDRMITPEIINSSTWTKVCILRIIKKIFLQNMGQAMGKEEASVQKEWIALLRELVFKLPGVSALNSLIPLCSEDPEADFFNNILHLQIHKRAMALSRFRNVINSGIFSESLSVKIFVPLFFNMMFDVKDGKGEHLRNAFLETLACISGKMEWEAYHRFLLRCFREMVLKPEKQKFLLRLICSVLDSFHFSNVEPIYEQKGGECKVLDSGSEETKSHDLPLTSHSKSYIPAEIQESLQKTVLPKVLKLQNSDPERINVNISLAALKLLKLLSLDSLEIHLPSIIHRISNFLKNPLESKRDEARAALVTCLKELGLAYLQFILKVLRATLKRGYELHVLGYTLNFLLTKCLSSPIVGSLDYCLEDLLLIVDNDILGDIAEEKEVDKIASKMRETRKSMSLETLKLISQNVSFRTNAFKLLSPIKAHLHNKHVTAKTKLKLQNMLHHIASGIKGNPSPDQKELLIFVYGLIEDGLVLENLWSKDSSVVEISKCLSHEMADSENTSGSRLQNSHLITVFALEVLNNCLKNMKFDMEDKQWLSMLDPFVKLLGDCLNSKYEDILSATFKCLAPLIRLPLPTINIYADKIKILLLDIAQKSPNANSSFVESSLRLLTVLLTRISLSNEQLQMLIQFPLFVDLQTNPSSVALSLLKQVVARKLEVPEVYDVVLRVAELMVTSQLESIRRKCSRILLKFLMDYPLSEKYRQQYLNFLLTNLSYEHASGREAVLDMLNAILVKFPKREVDIHAQTIFLHLVVCLANEREHKVQSMVATVIKLLIGCTSQTALYQILEYSLSWYTGEKQHLWGASAQVLGLLVEVYKQGFQGKVYDILRVSKDILESSLQSTANKELEFSEQAASPFSKNAYYSLAMFEKMLVQFPELYSDQSVEELWDAICKLLLHPHIQLRNISSHLVVLYFTTASDPGRVLNPENLFLMSSSRLFKIAVSFCIQLKSQPIDDATSNLITQNLVYTLCCLHSFTRTNKSIKLHEFWSALDPRERSCFLEAFELLGSRKVRNSFLLLSTEEISGPLDTMHSKQKDGPEDLQSLLVASLLKKMGKIAFLREDNQMKLVFNCYRMMTSQIGSEGCREYAFHVMEPLYKVCEGFSGKIISDEAKHFAEEVRDSIRDLLGVDYFIQVYNLIRKRLKEKRDKRKREERLIAVVDPMRDAKRKLRISAKHRAHKKRKIMGVKMQRWSR